MLLIESDPAHRDLLRVALEREKYSVECTGDPVRAELLIRRSRFDYVVLEMLLPGMNGLKLIRRTREDRSVHQPHFIVMSSLSFREVVEQVVELRVDGFLKKPVAPEELLARLGSIQSNVIGMQRGK